MINIQDGDIIGNDGGMKLVNTAPGTGSITIYKSNPDGSFPEIPFATINSATPENRKIFYLETPTGLSWRFNLTPNAEASYSKYQTR